MCDFFKKVSEHNFRYCLKTLFTNDCRMINYYFGCLAKELFWDSFYFFWEWQYLRFAIFLQLLCNRLHKSLKANKCFVIYIKVGCCMKKKFAMLHQLIGYVLVLTAYAIVSLQYFFQFFFIKRNAPPGFSASIIFTPYFNNNINISNLAKNY